MPGRPATREALEQVWGLADAMFRVEREGLAADLAWATMEALWWAMGAMHDTPVTGRRLRAPEAAQVAYERDVAHRRLQSAQTPGEHAALTGAVQALAFALGEPGPFWWTPLLPGVTAGGAAHAAPSARPSSA